MGFGARLMVGESCKIIIKIATPASTPSIVTRRGPDRFPRACMAARLIGKPPMTSDVSVRGLLQSEGAVNWFPQREHRTEHFVFSSKHSEQMRIVLTRYSLALIANIHRM
jgi:hypothetical protein